MLFTAQKVAFPSKIFIFFCSLQDLLTRHKVLVAEYLEQNYDAVSIRHVT